MSSDTQHDASPALVDRLIRWLPALLVGGTLVVLARTAAVPMDDPDVWWHLRLGNDLIHQHSFAAPPDWSPFATRPWTPSEPLPEVVAAFVERALGLAGVAWLYGVVMLAMFATYYVTNRRLARPLPAALCSVLTVCVLARSLSPRPQLVSFLLLAVVLAAWWATERDLRPRWWLIPLTWFWSLCHGFWFIGVAISVVCLVGLVLDRRVTVREAMRLALVPVGSFLVVLVNPHGVGVLEAPFAVNDTKKYIGEWRRTSIAEETVIVAVLITALLVVLMVLDWRRHRRVSFFRILLLVAATFLLWYAARMVALAGIVLGPLLAEALEARMPAETDVGPGADSGSGSGARRASRVEWRALVGWAVVCAAVLAVAVPSTSDRPGDVDPLGLDAALDALPAGTVVFNLYDVGGYLTWRHSDLHQVIDGLVVPYPNDYVDDYFDVLKERTGYEDFFARVGAHVALLKADSPLARTLEDDGWSGPTANAYVLLSQP